jgi:hypothetical protein
MSEQPPEWICGKRIDQGRNARDIEAIGHGSFG